MARIFISYRRNDNAAGYSRSLATELRAAFGEKHVFRDVKGIPPGTAFGDYIRDMLESCVVMLVVIGNRWVSESDEDGRQRLADPRDWVRIEVKTALERRIRVVPVLVAGARMPESEDLPEGLKGLADRNAFEMSDKRWEQDVEQLVHELAAMPGVPRPKRQWRSRTEQPSGFAALTSRYARRAAIAGGVLLGLLVVGVVLEESGGDPELPAQPGFFPASPAPPAPEAYAPEIAAPQTLSGLWLDGDGMPVMINQMGNRLEFVIGDAYGNPLGQGTGTVNGQRIDFQILRFDMGQGRGSGSLSPDGRSLTGSVSYPGEGTYPVILVRQ